MSDEYRLRKDIDKLKEQINRLDLSSYNPSEAATIMNKFDRDLDTLDTDLVTFSNTLTHLKSNLVAFNQELIDFDEDNQNLAEDLTKLKDNLHAFTSATQKLSTDLGSLDTALNQLDDDVFGDDGLDFQLSNLATVVGDANSGLVKGLADLDASLSSLDSDVDGLGTSVDGLLTAVGDNNSGLVKSMNTLKTTVGDNNSGLVKKANDTANGLSSLSSDVEGLGESVDGLMTAVGDNNSGLVKSMNTLQTTVGDANSGLVKKANDTASSVSQLSSDLNSLDGNLSSLSTTVGDANGGIVKNLNDLSSSFDTLEADIFGNNGLDSQLSNLQSVVGNNNSGLVKDLNDLDTYTTQFYNDVYGTNGLSSRLTATENALGTTDSDLAKLADSLSVLSQYLTTFEGSLEEFEQQLEDDGIDISTLNSNIIALFGAIGSVKSDVSSVESDISDAQTAIGNTNNSLKTVKTDLYGSKTVDGQTVPKDPSDTASSTSLKGHLTTLKDTTVPAVSSVANSASTAVSNVKTDLYGSNGTASQPANGSLKKNLQTVDDAINNSSTGLIVQLSDAQDDISTVQEDIYGDGTTKQGVIADLSDLNSTITDEGGLIDQLGDVGDNVNNVKGEVYGTKTVNGQTVPREPTDTPSANSLVGRANTVHEDIYGDGSTKQGVIADLGDLTGTITDEGGLIDQLDDVSGDVTAVQGTLYGSGTNNSPSNPSADSVIGKANAVKTDLYGTGSASSPQAGSVKANLNQVKNTDIPAVQTALYGNGTPQSPAASSTMGKIDAVKTDLYGTGSASSPQTGSLKDLINTVDDDINNQTNGLKVQAENLIETIGDESTPDTVLYDINQSQGHIENIQGIMYGTGTAQNPQSGTLMDDVDSAITQIGDKNTSGTILYDIDQVQGDIEVIEDSLVGLISDNRNKQVLYIGQGTSSLSSTFKLEGIDVDNVNYAYDTYTSKLKIRNKDIWSNIDNAYLNEVHFICGVVYRQSDLPSGATWADWIVYSVLDKKFYKRISNTWTDVTNNTNVLSSEKKQFMLSALFESYDGHTYSGIGFDGGSQIEFNKIVKDLLTVTNTHLSLPNAFTGHVYFTKYGRLVICDYRIEYTPSTAGETHLGNIPTDYLPASMYSSSKDSTLFRPTGSSIDVTTGTHKPTEVYPKLDDATSSVWQLKVVNQNTGTVNHARGQVMWFTDIL